MPTNNESRSISRMHGEKRWSPDLTLRETHLMWQWAEPTGSDLWIDCIRGCAFEHLASAGRGPFARPLSQIAIPVLPEKAPLDLEFTEVMVHRFNKCLEGQVKMPKVYLTLRIVWIFFPLNRFQRIQKTRDSISIQGHSLDTSAKFVN